MLWKDLEPYEESGMAVMDDHLAFYQSAVEARNQYTALRTGSIETILTDDEQDVMAFAREDDANRLLVILNARDEAPTSRCPSMANGNASSVPPAALPRLYRARDLWGGLPSVQALIMPHRIHFWKNGRRPAAPHLTARRARDRWGW